MLRVQAHLYLVLVSDGMAPEAIRHASVSIVTPFVSVALDLTNKTLVFTDQPSPPTGPHGVLGL